MKAAKPLLSVVLTTHNRSELLKRSLASVLACKNNNYEIILCADDDCPKTIDVARTMLRSHDSFIRIPSMRGPAQSRNIGAQVSRGKWVTFLDDDDTFSDQHISRLLEVLPNQSSKVLYFNYVECVESRVEDNVTLMSSIHKDISDRTSADLLVRNFIPIHAMVFSSELFFTHAFDAQLQSHEDWDFLVSLETSGVEFQWVDFGTDSVAVHIDSSASTRNKVGKIALDYLSIYRKWPSDEVVTQKARAEVLQRMGIKIDHAVL